MTNKYNNYFRMITDTVLNPTGELCTKERLTDSKNGEEHYTIGNSEDDVTVIKKENSEFEITFSGGFRIRHLNDEYGEIIQFFLPGKITEMARFSDKSTYKNSFDMVRRDNGLVDIIPISEDGILGIDLDGYLSSKTSSGFIEAYNRFKEVLSSERTNNSIISDEEYENPISNDSTDWRRLQGIVVGMPSSINPKEACALFKVLDGKNRERSALEIQLLNSERGKKKRRKNKSVTAPNLE